MSGFVDWTEKVKNCPRSDTSAQCPFAEDTIHEDFETEVKLHDYNLPQGAFCRWDINNPHKYEVEVEVKKAVSLELTVDNG